MANITPYNTQISAAAEIPGRRATASDFGSEGAAGWGIAGQAIQQGAQDFYDQAQEQEVSDARVKLAQARAKWTVELANRAESGDLADPTFPDKFMADFQNDLDAAGGNYATLGAQKAFREGSASVAAQMMQSAGVYHAQAVGMKAKQDYITYVDAHQNTLLRDPSQLQEVLTESLLALNDPNGAYARLPKGKREELARTTKEQLAKSAVLGAIRVDPVSAKQALEDGLYGDMLRGEDTIQLMSHADTAINGQLIEQARLETAQRKALEAAQKQTANQFIATLVSDPTGLSAQDVVNSNLDPNEKIQYLNYIRKGLDGTRDDKNTALPTLFSRIHLPPGDPNRISSEKDLYQYVDSGDLSLDGLSTLRRELDGSATVEGDIEGKLKKQVMDLAKTAITGTNDMIGMRDPKGDENYLRFTTWFLREYEAQTEAGKTPMQLLDPNSPDYLGKAVDQFKRPAAEFIKDLMEGAGTGLLAPDAGTPTNSPNAFRGNLDGPAKPTSKAEYDALPSGTKYIKDGVVKVKP